MKIIFCSYSGVHSAVLAGASYLGMVPAQKVASLQFLEVPFFGCQENKSQLRYLGDDRKGNQIYSLGVQGEMNLIQKAIENFLEIVHIPASDIMIINTYAYLSTLSRWGEWLARRGLLSVGNYLFCQGLKKDLPLLHQGVELKLQNSES